MDLFFRFEAASLAVSTTSARAQFRTSGQQTTLRLVNYGGSTVHLRTGDASVVATAADMVLLPGQSEYFQVPQSDSYLAAVTDSGTSSVSVTLGEFSE